MDPQRLKRMAAEAALPYVDGLDIIGVGTGSTVNAFIDLLPERLPGLREAVSSSEATTARLKQAGIRVRELNDTGSLPAYVDGADEADRHLRLIKGGGGALTREKIVAAASRHFVCIVDETKLVDLLGEFPLPVEVIPMARSYVAREVVRLGGHPALRDGVTTDNGNVILDVRHLDLTRPAAVEETINRIPGVVTVGLFARRTADVLLVARDGGVETITAG